MQKDTAYNADVIIVGSGAAGLMAAVEAAAAGAKVLVLESEAQTGGSTRLSGAYVALCETPLQPGTRAEFLDDLLESHQHDCQKDLSRLYAEEAPHTWKQLDGLGIHFVRTFQFAHMSKPWAHELSGERMGGGAEIVTVLESAARARGVAIVASTRARRLILDNGRVIGVTAERGGRTFPYRSRSVLLASGGFTRNRDLIRNFGRPGAEQILPLTGEGSRGDGLVMGMAAGAGTAYMTAGVAPTAPTDPATGKGVMMLYAGAIAVNKAGKRFCRESDLYIDTCWAALAQPDAAFVQVYDNRMRENYAQTMMGKVLTGFDETSAGLLEGLATGIAKAGYDADATLATVESYNEAVRTGGDSEFNRTNLVGNSGELLPVAEPPFYAVHCCAGTTHFNGGLSVDTDMAVLDVFGEPIPGLYAAGETTGGFHGVGYMSGTFVGMALIFGRVAGRNAALTASTS
ncbi:MAG: FAD-dependent oxidoreductase [Rhizobiaceae bacterium]|nr:FAD-dependent oxidoreductase [Rhizobiaceae bacterium]